MDDQPENLILLEDVLAEEGFVVEAAADGRSALEKVEMNPPDCIILDIMMPRMDGFEVCRHLKSRRGTHIIPIVMLTALSGVDDKVRAFELGADDFLNKPVNVHELLARVRSMVRIKRLRAELNTSEHIIVSMVEALESKDPQAAGHSHRVTSMAILLAARLQLPPEQVEMVATAAILHDVGKIGLPDTLLREPAATSPEEVRRFRAHATLGERFLTPFRSLVQVRSLVRHHHERLDGSGYPDGLAGEAFDLPTEIVAICNFLDDLHTDLGMTHATARLRQAATDREFRQETVEALLEVVEEHDFFRADPQPWQDLLPPPRPAPTGTVVVGCAAPGTRDALQRILDAEGHAVVSVARGQDVLDLVASSRPDLVLLDVQLPDRSGIEVCQRLKERRDTGFLPVVLVTAQGELDGRSHAKAWADDFLFLPVNRTELVARVASLLRLNLYFKDLEEHHSVILSLASALEAKDPYTRGHSERVGSLAARLGRVLGMSDEECLVLRTAGQLHDIGKIGTPETLLHKQGRLDAEEYTTIMQHPLVGERICQPLATMHAVLPLVRHHHERMDGSGYPDGLRGDELALGARILGLADAFDALTSSRSYRADFTPEEALELLARETREGRWDPRVFTALEDLVREPGPSRSLRAASS